MRLGDVVTPEFKDMTAEQQAAWLDNQASATGISSGIAFKDMTAEQQTAFLNLSDFNALTPVQQSALLNTLSNPSWIPGISNNMVIAGGAGLIVMAVLMGGKR